MGSAPDKDRISQALEVILASNTFARSERARDLLAYLVGKEQAGEADRLKGFAIGVDVFGKDSAFDPATDAVVRVQAGRLRQLLEQFYAEEAPAGLLRIDIPRGNYIPTYGEPGLLVAPGDPVIWTPDPHAPVSVEPVASDDEALLSLGAKAGMEPVSLERITAGNQFNLEQALERIELQQRTAIAKPLSRHFSMLWIAMAVVISLLILVTYTVGPFGERAAEETITASVPKRGYRGSITSEMLPIVSVHMQGEGVAIDRAARTLSNALASFDPVSLRRNAVVATSVPGDDAGSQDYRFMVSAGLRDGEVAVTLENVGSGASIWSGRLQGDLDPADLENQVANLLSVTVPVDGVIYADIEGNGTQSALTSCLLANSRYYKHPGPETHREAVDCLTRLKDAGAKSPLVFSELSVLILESVTDKRGYPLDASVNQAIELARLALQYGPQSSYAHRAMGYILFRTGEAAQSVEWARKAHELNPIDLSLAASYGYALVFTGADYKLAADVLGKAVQASSVHPSWWEFAQFLAEFMNGNDDKAFDTTHAFVESKRAHYRALRLIAADRQGNRDLAQSIIADIKADSPSFASDPEAFFRRGLYPEDLTKKLVDALVKAGLTADPA